MSKYLISTVETYRIDTEDAVKAFIDEAKNDNNYTLAKYSSEHKELKSKGEVYDEYFKVVLTKSFTSEKEPDVTASVHYDVEADF